MRVRTHARAHNSKPTHLQLDRAFFKLRHDLLAVLEKLLPGSVNRLAALLADTRLLLGLGLGLGFALSPGFFLIALSLLCSLLRLSLMVAMVVAEVMIEC